MMSRKLMTECDYLHIDDKNVLIMKRRITSDDAGL